MRHLGLIVCAKLKIIVYVVFIISMSSFILNIVSANLYYKNGNRYIWPSGNINRGAVFFLSFDNFYSLILADDIYHSSVYMVISWHI